MICQNCGKALPDNAKFCDKCGAKLEIVQQQVYTNTINVADATKNTFSIDKSGIRKVVPVIVAAVVVLLLGIGLFNGRTVSEGKKSQNTEWHGYTADLEQGKRVKVATYQMAESGEAKYSFAYDIEGNLIQAYVNMDDEEELEHLTELCKDKLPLEYSEPSVHRVLDEETVENFFKGYVPMADGTNFYTYENGKNVVTWRIEGTNYSIQYSSSDFKVGNGRKLTKKIISDEGEAETTTYSFNSQNQLFRVVYTGATARYQTDIDYTDTGKLQRMTKKDMDTGETKFTYVMTYDSAERVLLQKYTGEASLLGIKYDTNWYYHYKYDEKGNLIQLKTDDYTETYVYDEQDNLIETVHFNAEGIQEYTHAWEYDKAGNNVKYLEYTVYGNKLYLKCQTDYEYNKNGEVVAQKGTEYFYEANSDFSVVNQINVEEGDWREIKTDTNSDNRSAYEWIFEYYTDEEWEQYLHDKEFTAL